MGIPTFSLGHFFCAVPPPFLPSTLPCPSSSPFQPPPPFSLLSARRSSHSTSPSVPCPLSATSHARLHLPPSGGHKNRGQSALRTRVGEKRSPSLASRTAPASPPPILAAGTLGRARAQTLPAIPARPTRPRATQPVLTVPRARALALARAAPQTRGAEHVRPHLSFLPPSPPAPSFSPSWPPQAHMPDPKGKPRSGTGTGAGTAATRQVRTRASRSLSSFSRAYRRGFQRHRG